MKKLLGVGVLALSLAYAGSAPAVDGAHIFKAKCSPCHGTEGQGTAMAPAFKGNAFVKGSPDATVAETIKNGRFGDGKKYKQFAIGMPAHKAMSDDEIRAVVAHLKSLAIDTSSTAVAGEKTSVDLNVNSAVQGGLFFKGKVINENNRPLPNIKITVDYSDRATTDQSGDFSFPIESAVWGERSPDHSVTINKQDSIDSNALYLSQNFGFKVFWGSEDRSNPRDKISIITHEGTADQAVRVILPENRLIIKLGEPSNVRRLKALYEEKNYKEFIERGSAFLEANKNKNGIGALKQLVSEAQKQIKLAEEEALQKKKLAEEELQKKMNEELPPVIAELNRLKGNKDFEAVASSGRSYLNKYPNTQNSYLEGIQALVKDAENEIEQRRAKAERIRLAAEQLRLAKEAKDREIEIKKERQRQAKLLSKCNGVILTMGEFYGNNNPYADKGKCANIIAASFQMTSATTGLFSISDSVADLVYIEFKAPFRGRFVEGVAKIKGVHAYRTNIGGSNAVPHLEMIEIKRSQ